MAKYLNFFEEVYYINLDTRIDRKKLFEDRSKIHDISAIRLSALTPDFDTALEFALKKCGDIEHVKYIFSIDPKITNKVGCTFSHQAIIKEAKEKGLKNVLIFEDDCIFHDNFKNKLEIYVEQLKDIEWDIFYLGGEIISDCSFITRNLARVHGGVYTAHAYAVNHTYYDRILESNSIPLDVFFVNDDHIRTIKIVGDEILATQDVLYSDLWDCHIDRDDVMNSSWSKYVIPKKKKRVLYTVPVHECPECVKQLCDGILHFDPDGIIVIHVSHIVKNIEEYSICKRENVYINPKQYHTGWGIDFTRIHISNYKLVKDKYDFSYVIFLTSNMLMVKSPIQYIQNYDAGFNSVSIDNIENYTNSWFSDIQKYDKYKKILKELNSKTMYGSIIDGSFVNIDIMNKIYQLYNKYIYNYEDELLSYNYPEEKIIPTISLNLTTNYSKSTILFINPDYYKVGSTNDDIFFIKKVTRKIDIILRKEYNNFLNGENKFIGHFYMNFKNWFNYEKLYKKIVEKSNENDLFVEIGVWNGSSTAFMGVEIYNSNKKIKFDAIDCFETGKEYAFDDDAYEKVKDNLKILIDNNIVNLIKGYSLDVINNYDDNSIDFCFLDISLDYTENVENIKKWLNKVKIGGILAGHDYETYHINVYNAVNDTLGINNVEKFENCYIYIKK